MNVPHSLRLKIGKLNRSKHAKETEALKENLRSIEM